MAISKLILNGVTQMDVTGLTAASGNTQSGYTGIGNDGINFNGSIGSGSVGTPIATKGTVSNHSVSVTPSVTHTAGIIDSGTKTGTAVTVSASELVSGSETKTANGTYDVTNLAELVVNVASGGASNIVSGTLHTGTTTGAAESHTIPYSGTGYPIAFFCWIKGGAYNSSDAGNTDWYNSTQRYAVGIWCGIKARTTEAPSYGTSGAANYGTTIAVYKNNASTATTYSRTSSMTANMFSSSNANNTATTVVRFRDKTTLSVFVASTSYGLWADTDYDYIAIYSE